MASSLTGKNESSQMSLMSSPWGAIQQLNGESFVGPYLYVSHRAMCAKTSAMPCMMYDAQRAAPHAIMHHARVTMTGRRRELNRAASLSGRIFSPRHDMAERCTGTSTSTPTRTTRQRRRRWRTHWWKMSGITAMTTGSPQP